ncbi:MAG: component of SufBCD complex [Brevirhabdus sp.]
MDVFSPIFELIDLRSFSNLWFWIALAVLWSTASHFVLGVPYDMVQRARRRGGQVAQDVHTMVRIQSRRIVYVADMAGLAIVGLLAFFLSGLVVLGFVYWVEFAQALFLLALPMSLVLFLRQRVARFILTHDPDDAALFSLLSRHRFWIQFIGMVSIIVTAIWGMYMNITISPLGN